MIDLKDTDTWTAPAADVVVGDLYAGVAFLDLDRDFGLALTPDDQPFAPVLFSLGVAIAIFDRYVVLAPVSTSLDVTHQDAFLRLIEIARESSDYVRLPEFNDELWVGDAVALLFRPQTLTRAFLEREPAQRLASMTDTARTIFSDRLRARS